MLFEAKGGVISMKKSNKPLKIKNENQKGELIENYNRCIFYFILLK